MRSDDYWKKRMAALEDHQYQKSAAYYQDVQEQYRRAVNDTVLDIEHWYQRLADNNGISLAAAKRLLKKNELDEFHWSVEQYIKAGEENAVDQRWMKELENASAKYHISYLQAMKLQMQQHAELLSAEFEGGVTTFLHKSYGDQYYRTAFEIAKGTEVGSNLAMLDTHSVELVLKGPWAGDGKNFSQRIWENRDKLTQRLHEGLTQNIIRGAAPDKVIDDLSRAMNVSRQQVGRLVMTESAAVASRARQDCFKELGVEEFEVVVTLDHITCSFCRDMDGKHFPVSDFLIGMTAPPFHPNCRCCTAPYFDDDFGQPGQRAARDPDTGKTYYVPADMTYKEWKESFVDNVQEQDIMRGIKKQVEKMTDHEPVSLFDIKSKYREDIVETVNRAPENIRKFIEQHRNEISFINEKANRGAREGIRGIRVNLKKDFENKRGKWTSVFHEIGHRIDRLSGRPSANPQFEDALKRDFENLVKEYQKLYNKNRIIAYEEIGRAISGARYHSVSDLFGGISENQCVGKYAHSIPGYWQRSGMLGMEAFAHFFEAMARSDIEKMNILKQSFPEAYKLFEKMMEELI